MEQQVGEDILKKEEQVLPQMGSSAGLPSQAPVFQSRQKCKFIDPPRQLPNRSYSLEPDMVNGWKPKQGCKANLNNVFSINYEQDIVDDVIKELMKSKKGKDRLVYLGPRRTNSYLLHQNKSYPNPYPLEKKQNQIASGRRGLGTNPKLQEHVLKFDSDFESGNLDAAVCRGNNQYDLFMRVDTNTRGHTNWYYFSISNGQFVGTVKLTLCNFRREKSLYQRGMKPYIYSKLQDSEWHQGGKSICYERKRPKYDCLQDDYDSQDQYILNTYFAMSFSYDFTLPHDTVYFAYCIPYTYTRLLKFLSKLQYTTKMPPLKTLSGLSIPVISVTDENEPQYNKQVVLMTGRVHPGQSNSSLVAQGVLSFVCSNDPVAKELRKGYLFYIIPMLNPDGVIAGNYRTSLFGKDLNRTFNQSRRFAFPQTYHLVQLTKQLKSKHKKRFNIYIDLHGHSVKKNVFMYGPQFSIQHTNYQLSRQLPKLLGSVTSLFRYYSCIFRISGEKATTARAILNRNIEIAFTYTMEASNGFYVDPTSKLDVPFTSTKFRQMGIYLCKSLSLLKLDQNTRIRRQNKKISKDETFWSEKLSDDQISEGKSDSQPQNQDLPEEQLQKIEQSVKPQKQQQQIPKKSSPSKSIVLTKFDSRQLHKNKSKEKVSVFLPPIKSSQGTIFSERGRKKQLLKQQRLRNIQSQGEINFMPQQKSFSTKPRYSWSEIVSDPRGLNQYIPAKMRKQIVTRKSKIIVSKQVFKW